MISNAKPARPARGVGSKSRRRKNHPGGGFSILEAILALAILAGSLVVVGELMRLGLRNAELARDLTRAQLLCESKLAEITSRAAPAEPVADAVFPMDPEWLYAVDLLPTETPGLLAVQVTVYRFDARHNSARFTLMQLISDPAMEATPAPFAAAGGGQSFSYRGLP